MATTPLRVVTNLLLLGIFAATLGWVMFAASIDDLPDSRASSSGGAAPIRRLWRRSPAPVVGPSQRESGVICAPPIASVPCAFPPTSLRPPLRPFLIDEERGIEFNLRLCECRRDYKELKGEPGVCRCNGLCPAFARPCLPDGSRRAKSL